MEPIFKPKAVAKDGELGIALSAATALLGATLAQDDTVVAVAGVIVAGLLLGAAVVWRFKLRSAGLAADARQYSQETLGDDVVVGDAEDLIEESDAVTDEVFKDLIGSDLEGVLEIGEVDGVGE